MEYWPANTLRAAAGLAILMIDVTLLHGKGYFRQHLDEHGNQTDSPVNWYREAFKEPLRQQISIMVEGWALRIRAM